MLGGWHRGTAENDGRAMDEICVKGWGYLSNLRATDTTNRTGRKRRKSPYGSCATPRGMYRGLIWCLASTVGVEARTVTRIRQRVDLPRASVRSWALARALRIASLAPTPKRSSRRLREFPVIHVLRSLETVIKIQCLLHILQYSEGIRCNVK